jgi:hypothetical protein
MANGGRERTPIIWYNVGMKTIDVLIEERQIALDQLACAANLPVDRVAAIADGRWTPSPLEREQLSAALCLPIHEISWGHTMSPRNVRYHRFGLKEDF